MTLEVLLTKASFVLGSLWKLRRNIDGFKSENSDELVTQASIGRSFQLIDCLKFNFKNKEIIDRVKVRLLEDDYICWFRFSELNNNASKIKSWKSDVFTEKKILSNLILKIRKLSIELKCVFWKMTIFVGLDFLK